MKPAWLVLLCSFAQAQDFTQRGYIETSLTAYPQTAPGDSGQAIGNAQIRYEASQKIASWVRLYVAFDARTDSHRMAERDWRFDWQDRSIQRPAFSLRRLSAVAHKGPISFEFGKQFIRWGKADVFNPMDRFAPRDFLNVVDTDFLGVPAARLTYEKGSETFEIISQLRFTPSRIPLLNQRWVVLPEQANGITFVNGQRRYPGGTATGVRWNHLAKGYEYSFAFYDGHNHLSQFDAAITPKLAVAINQSYAQMRMYGATAAVPLQWFTLKGESAYFTSSTKTVDEYFQYVVQLERQSGEWSFVGGYAGEVVTLHRNPFGFAPDRGLSKAFVGRASLQIDPQQVMAFEAAIRQNGDGTWIKGEYTRTLSAQWKAVGGFSWIRGVAGDFLGQYKRNSHAQLALRWSF